MQQMTDDSDLRAQIDSAIGTGDAVLAHTLLNRLWHERPGPTLAGYITGRYERLGSTVALVPTKIALLRSYTLEPVVAMLRAAGFTNGFDLNIQVGDFNTYAQDIFNQQSNLYAFAPDIAILAVQTRDIAPELWERFADLSASEVQAVVERVAQELGTLVRTFRERNQAHLILHNLEQVPFAASGVLDAQQPNGQSEAIKQINRRLAEIARANSGVYILDYDGLIARCGREAWYDERKWHSMRMPIRAEWLVRVAQEWLRFIYPLRGKLCKALIVDLDNTLWGGIIGEDGRDGIKIGQDYTGAAYQALQRALLDLRQRGILLAICSKNNFQDAHDVLEHHSGMLLRPEHFAAMRINWENKADNLRSIAKELNIGIDALAFLDDNPAECQLIRSELPEITVIELPSDPGTYAQLLRSIPVFERLSFSAEDRERGRYYVEQRQRTDLEQQSGSIEQFLLSLKTRIEVAPVSKSTLARTAQLTQKTNQFNLTTRRYSEQQIAQLITEPAWRTFTAHAVDRFGDHGLIAVMLVHTDSRVWEIDTLLLSCRVIGRGIETALLALVADLARQKDVTSLTGQFIATAKNAPARDFYISHGFSCSEEHEQTTTWVLDLEYHMVTTPAWIECHIQEELIQP